MMGQEGKSIFRAHTILAAIVGLLIVVITLFTILQTAKHKGLWLDEKCEVTSLCQFSFGHIIVGRTLTQSNKSPLYFLLQKLSLSQIDSFDANILVSVRSVSIGAAVLMCLALFVFIHIHLGLLLAIFIVISVTSQYLFYNFAAENRPYMTWILLLALLAVATLKMCLQSYEKSSLKDRILFVISVLAITLVISFGVIQSGMAILTCLFCWYCVHDRPKSLSPLTHFAIPLCLVCILIQGYYTLQGVDAFVSQIMESQFDLISQIKRGDGSLLKMPLRLLFPKAPRDIYWGAYLANIFVLLGMGIPFVWWKKRKILKDKDLFIFVLSIVALTQVAATFIIALLIAFLHYWFVQRLFLYLIVCHALLASTGAYFVLSLNKNILKPLTKGVLLILICLSLNWHWQYYSSFNNPEFTKPCNSMIDDAENNWELINKEYTYERLDYIVERNQRLEACHWARDLQAERRGFCQSLSGNFLDVDSPF